MPLTDILSGDDLYLSGYGTEIGGDNSYLMGNDDQLMGALQMARRSGSRSSSSLQRAALARAAGGAVVRQNSPTKVQNLPLGFDSVTAVTKATSAKITARTQKPFRVDRLVVSSAIAGNFLIDSLVVGTNNQFLSSDAVPATAFSELAVGISLKGDTADVGIDITLSVTNLDTGTDHRFNGMIVGPAVS